MVDYREILRLASLKHSQRTIASIVGSSRNTVNAVLAAAETSGVEWPQVGEISNAMLQETLFPGKFSTTRQYAEPEYSYIHRELAKSGVTLTLLWAEYCRKVRDDHGTPYMYTQFCEKYRQWARLTRATMRIQHKPGEAMQVDWAGNSIPVYDPVTGEESKAYLFVAVLPCSCYAYVEACPDMKAESWLLCHAHAYSYYGGVTRLLIPDNLKTGVTANTRYDTVLNRSYQELAEHYDTAIVPARVRHPQDKSLAEGTVRFASTWVIAALRNRKFFSVGEVQQAVSERLEILNNAPFKKREGCRREAYLSEEKSFMKQLPTTPYEPAVWIMAKVGYDYLVSDGLNKYSTPYDLIGEEVSVRITRNTVEVFFKGSRVAAHLRKTTAQRDPLVNPEHMTPEHRKYLNYNAQDFMSWAETIGSKATAVVRYFLFSGKEAEQGYKSCASLTRLADRYGAKRLEAACARMMELTSSPTMRSISSILKKCVTATSPPHVRRKNRTATALPEAQTTSAKGVHTMINQSTADILKTMRFSAMAAEFEKQMSDPSAYGQLGFEERLGLLVDAEWNRRQASKLNRCIRNARFAIPAATIEGIEYYEDRRLDKAQILRFSTCKYIEDGHHIILKGASGNGKTYLACALGNAACRKFKSVRYVRMPELLDELVLARAEGAFKKAIKGYQKVDLLILDEWLIRCLNPQE